MGFDLLIQGAMAAAVNRVEVKKMFTRIRTGPIILSSTLRSLLGVGFE